MKFILAKQRQLEVMEMLEAERQRKLSLDEDQNARAAQSK
jgi:hypothetical protein